MPSKGMINTQISYTAAHKQVVYKPPVKSELLICSSLCFVTICAVH